jgi:hypothetical protein
MMAMQQQAPQAAMQQFYPPHFYMQGASVPPVRHTPTHHPTPPRPMCILRSA